ncbi:MAG: amino acid adenylation domain-containing protein, partial [Blastocatellia bacterium]
MAVDKGNVEAVYPLSPMQSGMLFHSLREPQAGYHIEQNRYTLTGKLNIESFELAWRKVIGRHSILRTAFSSAGKMSQVVFRDVALPIDKQDLRHLLPAEQEDRLRAVLEADRRRVSETTKAPLMRLTLLRMADDSYLFIWSCHHLLMDGWSCAMVLDELVAYYNADEQGRELNLPSPKPFHDYILWLQKQDRGRAEEFWKTSLQGFSAPTPLPIQVARNNVMNGNRRAQKEIKLPASARDSLSLWARQHHLTLNTVMQGVWALLLSRYSGEADVVFGMTVAGRPANLPGSENMVGIFINTLPLRVQFNPQDRVLDWLGELQQRQAGVTEYQYAALVDIQGWSEVPRGVQLFNSLLIFENYPIKAFDGMGSNGSSLQVQAHASELKLNYPLAFTVIANPEMTLEIGYDPELFTSESVDRMLANLEVLLAVMVNVQDQKMSELSLLSEVERDCLLLEWNHTSVDYGRHCIHELFERQVMRNAHATALIYEGQWVSYEDLNRRANQLAHYLAVVGVGPEVRVAICMQRSIEMMTALIGVLKAGGVCVPLDPGYPAERISCMLDDSQASVLLTSQSLVNSLPAHSAGVLCLDTQWDLIAGQDAINPSIGIDSENAAYIIYTSGSTGKAKGVLLPHRAICNVMYWMTSEFPLGNLDRVVQKASISFDASMLEIFFPLAAGAAIIIAAPEGHRDVDYLIRFIADYEATYIDLVPSLLKAMLDTGQFHQRGPLRYISSGGEALSLETVNLYFDLFNLPLCNMYGPSETTIHSTTWNCRKDSKMREVPIGVPLTNTQVYVLDEQKHLVPIGGAGELYIAGKGVARGYLNQPGLTAEKFLPNPFSAEPGDRMYRTGDWVRWSDNGYLSYLGRRDHQVKIRGFRIELGEIEAALERHPVVEHAVVMKREDKSGNGSLVAYVVLSHEADKRAKNGSDNLAPALRRHLKDSLPNYMVPSAFVEIKRLPLTPSGKLDRKALPAPDQIIDSGSAYNAPRSQVEEILCGIWEQILGSGRVGIEENFFEVGGHSLLAAQVISRIRDVLRVELPLRILFESPTVAGLAQELEQATWQRLGAEPEILPISRDRLLPLSYAQQRLWFIDQLEPGSSAYNVPTAVRLRGELDVAALRRSISEIIRRHEVLRTSFPQREGQPFQQINPACELDMPVIDLSEEAVKEAEATAQRVVGEETQQGFDLRRGPMLRAKLIRIGEADHVLVVTMHHVASDGWSVGILIREFTKLYRAYSEGEEAVVEEMRLQYADFAVWQREYLKGEVLEEQMKYWKGQLEGVSALELPTDRLRPPVASHTGEWVRFSWDQELTAHLKALARQEGATLFMVLLAGFQLLLSRYSGQRDVAIGTDVANRNRSEIEGLIGFFINQLVLRCCVDPQNSFEHLLRQVRKVTLDAYQHQDLPFEKLVDELSPQRDMSRSPLFQVKLVLQNTPHEQLSLGTLRLESFELESKQIKLDLNLMFDERADQLMGALNYSTDLFDPQTAQALVQHLRVLLAAAVVDPKRPVGQLPLMSQEEREQLLFVWNDTKLDYGTPDCVQVLFEQQARNNPATVAVVYEDQHLSYAELNRRANQLGHYLRRLGVDAEVRVALCLPRGLHMIVGLLGVLKAGGTYVPLDLTFPSERLGNMLDDSGAAVILTEEPIRDILPAHWAQTICLDRDWVEIAEESTDDLLLTTLPQNLLYVIYTSGSTGKPKGVAVEHRQMSHYVSSIVSRLGLKHGMKMALVSSIATDLGHTVIYPALCIGGELHLISTETATDPSAMRSYNEERQIECIKMTPTHMGALIQADQKTGLMPSRLLVLGGEACQWDWVSKMTHVAPECRIENHYGPTECTVGVITHHIQHKQFDSRPGSTVPLGKPLNNVQVYVLDDCAREVPIGVIGELYIGGNGVTRCYLNNAESTAERFLPDGFSGKPGARIYRTGDLVKWNYAGDLLFAGRSDHQIKIRGYRVELGEVEAALSACPAVAQAAVIAEGEGAQARLVAYVVSKPGQAATQEQLQQHVHKWLPAHMMPALYVDVKQMPLMANGKIDRKALQEIERGMSERREYKAARMPLEEVLCGICEQVLEVERVGIEENFFELGGHSLLATQVISRIRDVLGVELPLRVLFGRPTVAGLAEEIERAKGEGERAKQEMVAVSREQELPLSYAQQRLWFIDQLEPGSSAYNVPTAVRLRGELDVAALRRSISEIIRRHEVLRTSFPQREGQPFQQINPACELDMPVIDLSEEALKEAEVTAQRLVGEETQQGFDLRRGPMLRAKLIRIGEADHVLVVTMHHVASDGWSVGILIREFTKLYRAYSEGEE